MPTLEVGGAAVTTGDQTVSDPTVAVSRQLSAVSPRSDQGVHRVGW